ncbi:MAG: pyridoxamine 5'-phosphate oxidase [Citrobacter freundii]|nr:MAG: pyridoxamine 5'-phosphate oxidase [Citrobacter freundii]
MFGVLAESQIDQLLRKQVLGRLGCHADGLTYVVPISYAWHDGYLYMYTQEGLKISMLRSNKKVCFQVDNTRDLSNWQSVICWGEVEELTADEDRVAALQILNTRNFPVAITQKMRINSEWPFNPAKIAEIKGIFLRIRVEEKSGRYERTEEAPHMAG